MKNTAPITVASDTARFGGSFISYDETFSAVLGNAPRLVKVVDTDAHEGPVYVTSEDALYFTTLPSPTDIPLPGSRNVAIKRIALNSDQFPVSPTNVAIVRESSNLANGMTLDNAGRLVICEQGTRAEPARISCLDLATNAIETVVDQWFGLRLNSPNDVVVKSDGTIWFTDPSYGFLQGFKPEPMIGDYVYRFDPQTNRLSVVADSFTKPNGLAFSPDESLLYITDSGANQEQGSYYVHLPHHIQVFDVIEGRRLANGRLFAVTTPGFPDGIKVDSEGRVYASAFSGVQVFSSLGDLIGEIRLPGAVNFTFGGPDNNILYITADTAVWAATLQATGANSHP
ncbi:MAG: SMP-30/gluconolactonase/LRE family protein [Chloroflexales bacterium]|nr:SMP-30/gluconolactonase/LRE family protein [Chloroflexales bacterium]